MRMGVVILLLAGIAVALVHVRRAEIITRHEIQRHRMQQVKLRRQLWDQQVRLGLLTSPEKVRKRVEQMKLDLVRRAPGAGESPTGPHGPAEGRPGEREENTPHTSQPDMELWSPPR